MLNDFKDFLLRGNVVDLAVAFVIGVAFAAIVAAFSTDFIGGIIGAIGGTPDFGDAGVTINGSKIVYGSTINAAINFVIVAAVVYFVVVRPLNALAQWRGKEEEEEQAEEIKLLAEIRDELRARR